MKLSFATILPALAVAGVMIAAAPAFAHGDHGSPHIDRTTSQGPREHHELQEKVTRLQTDIGRDEQQLMHEEQKLKVLEAQPAGPREMRDRQELQEHIQQLTKDVARDKGTLAVDQKELNTMAGPI